jgi:hypothetical protein
MHLEIFNTILRAYLPPVEVDSDDKALGLIRDVRIRHGPMIYWFGCPRSSFCQINEVLMFVEIIFGVFGTQPPPNKYARDSFAAPATPHPSRRASEITVCLGVARLPERMFESIVGIATGFLIANSVAM